MCRSRSGELYCLELNPQYVESFAYKVVPNAKREQVALIPWEREATFHVDEKGAITRSRVR